MPLTAIEKKDIEKDLKNSERYILEKLSKDRKVAYLRSERANMKQEEVLKEVKLLNSNVEAMTLLYSDQLKKHEERHDFLIIWEWIGKKQIRIMTFGFILLVGFWEQIYSVYEILRKKYL